jgi:hypothetical protein
LTTISVPYNLQPPDSTKAASFGAATASTPDKTRQTTIRIRLNNIQNPGKRHGNHCGGNRWKYK